jgi:diaminopimelate epimerase
MHGAANDFIVVDDRRETFPAQDKDWLVRTMSRHTGVGSEGVLLIQPSSRADFRMRFFNPDGGEVDMCGNGARCIARLACELEVAPPRMSIETAAGLVRAEIQDDQVLLHLYDPKDFRHGHLTIAGQTHAYHAVNTGVPHVVMEVPDVAAVDVARLGAAIRYHADFAPKGTNANFIQVTGPHAVRVRTYERGVEAETLACGTGIVAAGLIAAKIGRAAAPVQVTPASGDVLEVNFSPTADGATRVTLRGPAVHVFHGELEYQG